jgi:outer membrane biosynthesis protein TonB
MKGKELKRKTGLASFLRYRKNGMAGIERNAFERELQKDHFAEEADEGFSSYDAEMIRKDMDSLQKRLRLRTGPIRSNIYLRIAASVAVLVALASILLIIEKSRLATSPASVENRQIAFNIEVKPPIVKKEDITPPDKGPEVMNRKKSEIKAADMPEREKNITMPGEEANAHIAKQPDMISDTEPEPAALMADKLAAAEPVTKKEAARAAGIPTGKAYLNRQVAFTGYTPPAPINGNDNFDRYIDSNARKPDISRPGQQAVVIVNFTVRSDGIIDSINILRSPGVYYSNEARRLIRDGPPWKPATKDGIAITDTVRLKILFK